ncbi:transposase [Micromonospora sp. WMMD734]|uniref:transposase n=1 Tax=Micromonospora sp. WMMD734 TaxID=3404129 RepID=UPI003B94890E
MTSLPDRLHYRIRDRKRWCDFLSFLKTLRHRWPDQHFYLILDNFSPCKHRQVRAWCFANQVDLVFLPTYASWLNWVEAEDPCAGVAVSRRGRYPYSVPNRVDQGERHSASER